MEDREPASFRLDVRIAPVGAAGPATTERQATRGPHYRGRSAVARKLPGRSPRGSATHGPVKPVQRPLPSGDRPRPWLVGVSAASGLAAGLVLIHLTLDTDSTVATMEAGDPTEAETPAALPDAGAPDAATEYQPPALDDIVPGRVAYLRCDGLPTQQGPYPCPRDLRLEEDAWAAIDGLPLCPNGPMDAGEADIRIVFRRGLPPEVLVHDLQSSPQLAVQPLLDCLRPSLTALTTSLDADELVISFRFSLVASP